MNEKDIVVSRKRIKAFLTKYLKAEAKKFAKQSPWGHDIEAVLLPFVLSGKLLRGVLVLVAAGKINTNTLKVASAVELMHSGLLIHDDIMDQDLVRRGAPSVYARYAKLSPDLAQDWHYGLSQAISLGDVAMFLSILLMNQVNVPNKEKLQQVFLSDLVLTGFGQMQDVYTGTDQSNPTLAKILSVYELKTARYTINSPIVLGMRLSTESEKVIQAVTKSALEIGVAFQMRDDDLGFFGDATQTGKGVLEDVKQNKKTVLRQILMSRVFGQERIFANQVFGKKNLTKSDFKKLFDLMVKHKVRETHESMIESRVIKAKKLLKKVPEPYRSILEFVLAYNNNRSK